MLARTLAASLAALAATSAAAQTAVRTAPIEINAAPEVDSLTVPSVGDARKAIEQTPGGVDLVPAEEYRAGKANTLKDVLDYVPGVFIQSKYGQEDSRLSIRGSGLSHNNHLRGSLVLIDGVLNNRTDLFGDVQEIDPLAARYVEVFKGANGLQYGAATLGGVVNFVSPTGHDAARLLTRAEVGSFDTQRGHVSSGMAVGAWDYWAGGTATHSEGFRDHANQRYLRLNGNLGYRLAEGAETRFFLTANDINQRIPGSLTRTQAYAAPTSTPASSYALDTKRDQQSIRLANKTTFLLGDHEASIAVYAKDKDLFHPLSFAVIDQETEDYGAQARLSGEGRIADLRAGYVAGVNVAYGTTHSRQFVNNAGRRGALLNDVWEKSSNLTAYGEGRLWVLPEVALIAGLQANHATRALNDRFLANGDDSGTKDFDSINPKVGVLWTAAPGVQVFANVNRSSEPPTFGELNPSATPGFADLDPQRAWTVELGTRGSIFDNRVGFDLAFYRAWVKDELQLFVLPGSGAGGFAVNADRTIHQGIELGLTAEVVRGLFRPEGTPDKLTLRLAYTLGDFRFDNDSTFGNNELPNAPRHYVRGELRYAHPLGFFIGPNVEWVPRGYYVDNANTAALKTDGYALLGLKAGYEDAESGLTFFVDARNLLDKTYVSNTGSRPVATAADALYNPGDGMAFYAGIEVRW